MIKHNNNKKYIIKWNNITKTIIISCTFYDIIHVLFNVIIRHYNLTITGLMFTLFEILINMLLFNDMIDIIEKAKKLNNKKEDPTRQSKRSSYTVAKDNN